MPEDDPKLEALLREVEAAREEVGGEERLKRAIAALEAYKRGAGSGGILIE